VTRPPQDSVSSETRSVGTFFVRLEDKLDDATALGREVAGEWSQAQARLDDLDARMRQVLAQMEHLARDLQASATAHARLAARVEASEAAVHALSQGTKALEHLADALRRRLTARSMFMAAFAALGGGCGSVLAPQIARLLGVVGGVGQ
jgi:hypothetical protein